MIIISHRGNLEGPLPNKENSLEYIDDAIHQGFLVEVDLWVVSKELYLGHDKPQYKISSEWIEKRKNFLWIHYGYIGYEQRAKNEHCFFLRKM